MLSSSSIQSSLSDKVLLNARFRQVFEWSSVDDFNEWYNNFVANTGWFFLFDTLAVALLHPVLRGRDELLVLLSCLSSIGLDVVYLTATEPGSSVLR